MISTPEHTTPPEPHPPQSTTHLEPATRWMSATDAGGEDPDFFFAPGQKKQALVCRVPGLRDVMPQCR